MANRFFLHSQICLKNVSCTLLMLTSAIVRLLRGIVFPYNRYRPLPAVRVFKRLALYRILQFGQVTRTNFYLVLIQRVFSHTWIRFSHALPQWVTLEHLVGYRLQATDYGLLSEGIVKCRFSNVFTHVHNNSAINHISTWSQGQNKYSNVVHLMLRVVLAEKTAESRICILFDTPYISYAPGPGCAFRLTFAKFYELGAKILQKCLQ